MTEQDFVEETFNDESDALTLDDLSAGYIGNPKVDGDSVTFTVAKVVELKGNSLIGKKSDGSTFSKNLSKVDYGFEIVTDSGDKYTVAGWEVWGKLKGIFNKLKAIKGVKIRLTHVLDGMKAENKKLDKYKVEAEVEGVFKTLNRQTKEWETN